MVDLGIKSVSSKAVQTEHDPGDAPDVSTPFEAFIRQTEILGARQID